jgi:hypothetical protein
MIIFDLRREEVHILHRLKEAAASFSQIRHVFGRTRRFAVASMVVRIHSEAVFRQKPRKMVVA